MVISFEEKDRLAIESKGIMIIEFKWQLYNAEKTIKKVLKVLKEATDRVAGAWNALAEKILEAVDYVGLIFEQIREAYHYPTSHRYHIVKVLSKCTGIDIHFCWKSTWKIKRWIVRSRYRYIREPFSPK